MYKVSVIVPIYNSEDVLDRCINSILNQTYRNIEIILINDGSTDKSINIMKKYEKLDDRIIVVDNINNGVSETRNIGVIKSSGEYIQFVDSDDYIELDMIEKNISIMINENPDLIMSGLFLDIESAKGIDTSIQTFEEIKCVGKKEIAKSVLNRLDGTFVNSPVNKLYKSKIIKDNNIKMDKDIDLGEDLIFNLEYLKFCNNIIFSKECYYHYCMQLQDNLTFKYRGDQLQLMEVLYNKCNDYLKESNLDELEYVAINSIFIKWMYSCFINLHNRNCELTVIEKIKYIKLSIKRYKYITDKAINLTIVFKILRLAFICPTIVLIISKIIYLVKLKFRKIFYK